MTLLAEAQRLFIDALNTRGSLLTTELFAWLVFGSYFVLILASFGIVLASILDGVTWGRLIEGRAFYFVRAAVAALGCTWYFMIRFMQWSYQDHAAQLLKLGRHSTLGLWLLDTPLFEQAWGEVCSSPAKWWWSSFICTWTVLLTAIIWRESALRKIKYPWAYLLLGMSVAISVATALFITATFLHPRPDPSSPRWKAYAYAPVGLSIPLLASLYTVHLTPSTVGGPGPLGETFLKTVLWMHGLLVLPLVVPAMPLGDVVKVPRAEVRSGRETEAVEAVSPNAVDQGKKASKATEEKGEEHSTNDVSSIKLHAVRSPAVTATGPEPNRPPLYIPFQYFYLLLLFIVLQIHTRATLALFSHHASLPPSSPLASFSTVQYLLYTYLAHPAQASISSDVVCTLFIALSWLLCTGSYTSIFLKGLLAASIAAGGAIKVLGVNWRLIASLLPILAMAGVGLGMLGLSSVRGRNERKRKEVLEGLGLVENGVEQGAEGRAPRKVGRRMIVGFWHPYCNAGGGGERVLWSAIAYTQRTQPDTVCLVYSGDYPTASKEAILDRAQDRFSITIHPEKLIFIPLPSRFLIADDYWQSFTLLGQSLGSVYLAWEGLCGKDGLWGDVFIDTMGQGFTFPFARLVAGSQIVIGAYVHYPTVSTDMVRRVREGLVGVESGNVASGGWKKQIKLIYYHIFTTLYATALLFCETIMTNSTWTHNHIQSLLSRGGKGWLASLLLMDEVSERKRIERERAESGAAPAPDLRAAAGESEDGAHAESGRCEVLFPPCDTGGLVRFKLEGRGRGKGIVSLAQFRPEKEHAKQLYALQILFERYPQYRTGAGAVRLTMMGGVRDDADQARLDALKVLAAELGVAESVEFLANAPYPEVVRRLGGASLGLNTMQDEHFGINVVEFMAAGLIPIVHASAGPKLDIVVPQNGQQTGYHGTDAASFAEAVHSALSLDDARDVKMRQAARDRAVQVFSQEAFERGWERHWMGMRGLAVARARERGEVLEN